MTNREKLFKALNKMNNKDLSLTVSLNCEECPCYGYCKEIEGYSCNKVLEWWLDEDNKKERT